MDRVLDLSGLDALIAGLHQRGYDVLGPTMRDDVVTYGTITSTADLPAGVGDAQGPGRYRTRERGDGLLFGYAAPVQSAKPSFLTADQLLWRSRVATGEDGASVPVVEREPAEPPRPVAYVGLRSCDLAALAQHDRILTERGAVDVHYEGRRRTSFLVAVTCSDPAATCFCASVGTGPAPGDGYDIALTEVLEPVHRFVASSGSERGDELLDEIGAPPATEQDRHAAVLVTEAATARMTRQLPTDDLVGVLYTAVESPRWEAVAERCLACSNCTLVCPTCFCTTITDVSDLAGQTGERHRVWASCFTKDYSYIHGGSVRTSTKARYRQWLTHKLAAWQLQFDSVGCVGCGRCIAWCPAGIDLVAEVAALRGGDAGATASAAGQTGKD